MTQSPSIVSTLTELADPFPPQFVEWKPQATSKDGKRALAAAFIDARHYQYRLDLVSPGWETEYDFIKPDGSLVKCRLTINGVTREEVGESDPGEDNTATSAVAQSFKRACAAFGLGRYLYFLPQVWCDYDAQSRKIVTPPALPGWAKPGGSGYPSATGKTSRTRDTSKKGGQQSQTEESVDEPALTDTPSGQEQEFMSHEEAASVLFTLKPRTRPELSGKTMGEVAEVAPEILNWLAEQYSPTPETQHLKEAAVVLSQ
jgi:hypothetical protein